MMFDKAIFLDNLEYLIKEKNIPVRLQTESVKGRVRKRTFDQNEKASRTEKRNGGTDRRHHVPRSQADIVAAAGVTQQQQFKE